jgi:hypothetical protein
MPKTMFGGGLLSVRSRKTAFAFYPTSDFLDSVHFYREAGDSLTIGFS